MPPVGFLGVIKKIGFSLSWATFIYFFSDLLQKRNKIL